MNLNLLFDEAPKKPKSTSSEVTCSSSVVVKAPQYSAAVLEVLPIDNNGILVIGDMPVKEDSTLPFDNAPYGTLCKMLRGAGLVFDECIRAVACPAYPTKGIITEEYTTLARKNVDRLKLLCLTLRPRAVLLLGRQTLRFFKDNCDGVDEERGAPFRWRYGPEFADSVVCISTYHPTELYREWHNSVIVEADIAKLVRYSKEGWQEPTYDIVYQPSLQDCLQFLRRALEEKLILAVDFEFQHGIVGDYSVCTCVGFGLNTKRAFTIPFVKAGNKHYFTYEEEVILWPWIAKVLEQNKLGGQNAVHYDHWAGAYWLGILLNVVFDTMFAHWEVYTELPKSLAFQNSLYCNNPYWKNVLKDSRAEKIPREMEFHYNGLDNVVCLQSAYAIKKEMAELPPAVKLHYQFNIRLSRVFQYMSLRGVRLNRELRDARLVQLEQQQVDDEQKLHDLLGFKLSVGSPKQMKEWLYEKLKLPVRTKMVTLDDGTKEDRETADFLTLAYLAREYPDLPALMMAANLRKLKKRTSSLRVIKTGPNGEIYWNFSCVGTETGRAAGYKPNNGMGVQPQNPDKRDRDLYLPGDPSEEDPYLWLKADLEGSDAWTVAAQMAVLGDDTMFEDLKAGLKPALLLALATKYGDQLMSSRDRVMLKGLATENKAFFKTPAGKQSYDTTKAVSHGTNYKMQAPTMHMTVFSKSKGELYVPIPQCETFRLLYLKRYQGLTKLYQYIPTLINQQGYLDCPSGMRRTFFGRADNHRTRVGLALIPQNNTANATNTTLHRLFYSSYNRRSNGRSLVIEPLNQVHDEVALAFRRSELDQAREIFKVASTFTSSVWGKEFVIPFDPNFGPNWGSSPEDF